MQRNTQRIATNASPGVLLPAVVEDSTELYRELAENALLRYRKHLETQGRGCQDGHRLSIVSQSSSSLFPEADSLKDDDESSAPSDAQEYAPGSIRPQPKDVLFGRRRSYRLHPGNVHLRRLCDEHLNLFESLAKGGKNELTKVLLDQIIREGGRFIKYDSKLKRWLTVTTEEARVKIAHRFRDARNSRDVAKKPKKESKTAKQKNPACTTPAFQSTPTSQFLHPQHALEALQALMFR